MKYIVNVSGGLTSFEALRRTIEPHGKENTHAYFADTKQEDDGGGGSHKTIGPVQVLATYSKQSRQC